MKRITDALKFPLPLFAAVISLVFVCGCLPLQVAVEPGMKLDKYRKVYVGENKDDPRKVAPRIAMRLKKAGFEVVEVKPDHPLIDSQGSGIVITAQGHVLTCAHAVGKETNATVWIQGTRHIGQVVACDTNLDLAVIKLEGAEPFNPIPFAAGTNYSMGQDAFSMGFPMVEVLGVSPRLNKGLISSSVGMNDDPKAVQFSAQVQPGNSGGPLLNAQGEVIGLVNATLNPSIALMESGGALPQNVNFALKTGPIREFLTASKIALPVITRDKSDQIFEESTKSLALVRSGIVTEDELKQPALLCFCIYDSFWDMWFRFRTLIIGFKDLKSGKIVFKAGQYHDDPFSSEDGELDRIFTKVSDKFFPGRPNPFKGEKEPEKKPAAAQP